jgi:hypothetical protein
MPYSELLDSLIHTARHGAGFILSRYQRVVPSAVQFIHEDDPRVYHCFPLEEHPRATTEELLALTEAWLRDRAARPETCALALVTEVQRDDQRLMVLQAETRREAVLLHYPLRKKWLGWTLGEAEEVEGEPPGRLLPTRTDSA